MDSVLHFPITTVSGSFDFVSCHLWVLTIVSMSFNLSVGFLFILTRILVCGEAEVNRVCSKPPTFGEHREP